MYPSSHQKQSKLNYFLNFLSIHLQSLLVQSLTCTTGVPKFSGSVRGRWSRVCKEEWRYNMCTHISVISDAILRNTHQRIQRSSFNTYLAFVKMSFSFQTQRSPSQRSFITIIKNLKEINMSVIKALFCFKNTVKLASLLHQLRQGKTLPYQQYICWHRWVWLSSLPCTVHRDFWPLQLLLPWEGSTVTVKMCENTTFRKKHNLNASSWWK